VQPILDKLNKKRWSSLTGVRGYIERTFPKVKIVEFDGMRLTIMYRRKKAKLGLVSYNDKGSQLTVDLK